MNQKNAAELRKQSADEAAYALGSALGLLDFVRTHVSDPQKQANLRAYLRPAHLDLIERFQAAGAVVGRPNS